MEVLFVEDHAGTRRAVSKRLRASGFTVTAVASAEAALEASTRQEAVALVDLNLGGSLTGIDVVRTLSVDLPCVIFTQDDDPARLQEAFLAGAVGYLLKSDPPELVITSLEQALHGQHPISAAMTRHLLGPIRASSPNGYTLTVDLTESRATLTGAGMVEVLFRGERSVSLLYALGKRFAEERGAGRGWMLDEQLMSALWGQRGRGLAKNNINVLVHRLRREVQRASLDRGFIEKRTGRTRLVVGTVVLT